MTAIRQWFFELLTEDNGRASWTKSMAILAYFTVTWVFIRITLQNAMTPEYMVIYIGACFGVRQVSKYMSAKSGVTAGPGPATDAPPAPPENT